VIGKGFNNLRFVGSVRGTVLMVHIQLGVGAAKMESVITEVIMRDPDVRDGVHIALLAGD
jgi:hypothetical protein